jgi:hypothetical protein
LFIPPFIFLFVCLGVLVEALHYIYNGCETCIWEGNKGEKRLHCLARKDAMCESEMDGWMDVASTAAARVGG